MAVAQLAIPLRDLWHLAIYGFLSSIICCHPSGVIFQAHSERQILCKVFITIFP
jgi:hypothetical protein